MKAHLMNWLSSGDTGASSLALLAHMERDLVLTAMLRFGFAHPLDPSDLGRCIRLMDIEPSYRTRIGEMAAVSPQWAVLASHWSELETLYRSEVPEHKGRAPKTYARMWKLLKAVRS